MTLRQVVELGKPWRRKDWNFWLKPVSREMLEHLKSGGSGAVFLLEVLQDNGGLQEIPRNGGYTLTLSDAIAEDYVAEEEHEFLITVTAKVTAYNRHDALTELAGLLQAYLPWGWRSAHEDVSDVTSERLNFQIQEPSETKAEEAA